MPYLCSRTIPVVIGDLEGINALRKALFKKSRVPFKPFGKGKKGDVEVIDCRLIDTIKFGVADPRYGEASYQYIIEALKLIMLGEVSAIVTCPINKKSFHLAGIPFTGHTELLAHYAGVTEYVMMMVNRNFRVSLVTIHIPLKEVPLTLSCEKIVRCITITNHSLQYYFDTKKPYIKVCSLNPHGGEEGIMGDEESIISDAIDKARSMGIHVDGPFPADSLFHTINCDAYIAMYHDQGLIPVKTIDFKRTVNITLGLPFIRTSPGHGTGFDIAGKGIADPKGLIEAYRIAERMSLHS